MIRMLRGLLAAALLAIVTPADAQVVTNHAIAVGRAPAIGLVGVPVGTDGQVPLGQTGADPSFKTLSGDVSAVAAGGAVTLDPEIHCLAALTSAADKIAYYTGSGTCAVTDLSSGERTFLTTPSSANLRGVLTDETGTGFAYFQGGDIGMPSAGVLTNATGLPISTGVSGLGSNVATFLGTASSANLRSALTDEVGTGAAYFVGGALGTPASATLTNATGLPLSSGVTGTLPVANGGTGQTTAAAARASSGLNIDQATTRGDADYTILSTDRTVVTTTTFTALRTFTLPAANSVNAGQHIIVADMAGAINGANTLSIARGSSDTINGVTSVALTAQYAYIDLVSDGASKWTYQRASGGGGSGTVTNATIAAGTGISVSGTCAITTSGTCTVSVADQHRQNQLLICANQAKSQAAYQRVLETFCDGYKASDGVNSGSSSNYSVSTSSGYVGPNAISGTVTASAAVTGAGTQPSITFRNWFAASVVSTSGTYVRVKLVGPSSGTPKTWSNVFVGNAAAAGDAYDFDGNQVRLTFSGSNSVTPPVGGSIYSDWVAYSLDEAKAAIVAIDGSASESTASVSGLGANYNAYYKASVADSSTTDATGYTSTSGQIYAVAEIQVKSTSATVNNMTTVTTSQTADATVDHARVLLEIDPIDSITLGTDLTIEVTCNGGTNWTAAGSYTSAGKGQSGRTVIETDDVSCTSGTSFAARIKTLNNKSINVYKTAVVVH